jgi:hypothetical protein
MKFLALRTKFCLLQCTRRVMASYCSVGMGVKRPGNEANYSSPLKLRLKMRGIISLLSPYPFMTRCCIKSCGNFNFSTLPAVFCSFVAY